MKTQEEWESMSITLQRRLRAAKTRAGFEFELGKCDCQVGAGMAAHIRIADAAHRAKVVAALLGAEIVRIGFGLNHIHVDGAAHRTKRVAWIISRRSVESEGYSTLIEKGGRNG